MCGCLTGRMDAKPFITSFILPHEEVFARGHQGDEAWVITEHVAGDTGGATKFGIDQTSHPDVVVDSLTKESAIDIYTKEFDASGFGDLPYRLACLVFDIKVNGGPAVRFLQDGINALPAFHGPFALKVDGVLGPITVNAARRLSETDETVVLTVMLQEREQRYLALAREHPAKRKFVAGWLTRNNDIASYFGVHFD